MKRMDKTDAPDLKSGVVYTGIGSGMMRKKLALTIDRKTKVPISEQIRRGITEAIREGVLLPGTRLPSWIDLAVQLGVSRGTVKTAYDRLFDEQLVVTSRSRGTSIAEHLPANMVCPVSPEPLPASEMYQEYWSPAGVFQMGVPADDAFPVPLFSRLFAAAARETMSSSHHYGDPRGESALRREIAGLLVLSRGIKCHPSQIFITAGFTGALGLILHALSLSGQKAWVENPGFPPARRALELAGLTIVPVSVDAEGINTEHGIRLAPEAALALVTPGQQAPLGMTLSRTRRNQLLAWAHQNSSWILEDDYLGELQLNRRAAPALASQDTSGRVIHIGSFSKTISPKLRLGFVVVPHSLIDVVADVAACLSPAPDPALQMATRAFLNEGHFLRHLRKMKKIYGIRSIELAKILQQAGYRPEINGLSVLLPLAENVSDRAIARHAYHYNLAPSPLSGWYLPGIPARSGLLLGISGKHDATLEQACEQLDSLIRKFST
ncbi:HTH-type transcriptional regulatory protein GabR [Mixta intestinalis]|uniref:HTH-type transcriptional regulatory protein GabR n=2 Tax=Mixta intestinalis TaxID=1615494 RepID=A0A6P1PZV1_9GAMM|nr:HTH-type transcriptional regulatory protein GabR [Mixta intestinalis]